MKHKELSIGGLYLAKVSGRIVPVRLDAIREVFHHSPNGTYVYDVTNTVTGRKTTFRSPQKFRGHAKQSLPSGTSAANRNAPWIGQDMTDDEPLSDTLHPEGF